MEREEAISWLVSLTEHEGEDVPIYDDDVEALNMAISALEHPEKNVIAVVPCGDAISRADALDCVNWGYSFSDIYKKINELPSVTPQEPIIDKIRAEIDKARFVDKDTRICKNALASGLEVAMQILDKYKTKSEDKE